MGCGKVRAEPLNSLALLLEILQLVGRSASFPSNKNILLSENYRFGLGPPVGHVESAFVVVHLQLYQTERRQDEMDSPRSLGCYSPSRRYRTHYISPQHL